MSKTNKNLIDIPNEKGIHIKATGTKRESYVYMYTKHYRNADGDPRHDAKCIGKLDVSSGKMKPNANYYETFELVPTLSFNSVWHYGYTYLVDKCCNDIGLSDCLYNVFGNNAKKIIAAAMYIIQEGNAMDGIDDWQEHNFIPDSCSILTSQTCSKLFESLSTQTIQQFFSGWVTKVLHGESVCYDVTSISSYSKVITDVEYGYNRDGENLCQFNIGIFCNETTKMPIYYNRYNGSLTDKTNLSFALENARAVGINNVKLVLDGGFISAECFAALNKIGKSFTIGIPMSQKTSKQMHSQYSSQILQHVNKLKDFDIYCVQKTSNLHGVNGKSMLFFDPATHAELLKTLNAKIKTLSSELSSIKYFPSRTASRYSKYFVLEKHEIDNGFDFKENYSSIDQALHGKGYFMLFTSDMEANPNDSLFFYRAKDAAEKLFDQIKIDMQGNRIRTHNQETTDGKTFVTFIALTIRTYMLCKLNSYLAINSTSLKKTLKKLENIMVVSGETGTRFVKALTKQQKDILACFGAVNEITESLKTCIR
jgi:transposase